VQSMIAIFGNVVATLVAVGLFAATVRGRRIR
jgi:hypothetical protein